ncbi:MAG: hypothetical protein KGQ48_03610 [Bradyrhizobium sp.]|uniref:hypothetical protein n=1 Tax=Bradyrhizobium sp. TaxID=376 RepID=UPI001EBEA9F4|nr:hypothetical protein [Bradyrhizobium sp.]MBU6456611.1 hypothetical protein [Bradyrhizobium sp.]MDE2601431.1 hypothetical protein [Bradyrhizobium sp.]
MNKTTVGISYLQSLLWTALFFAVAIGVSIVVELAIVDFIHGNPHRPQSNAIFMMITFPPVMGVIAAIGVFLVFTLPQVLQALFVGFLDRKFEGRAHFTILLALPFTAVLTWYCDDYLTPSNVQLIPGPDWQPYQHGISMARYLKAMGFQAIVTLFGLLYFDAGHRGRSRKPVVIIALFVALTVGGIWGYVLARHQFQFL